MYRDIYMQAVTVVAADRLTDSKRSGPKLSDEREAAAIKASRALRLLKAQVQAAVKELGDNVLFKPISVQDLVKDPGRVSILRRRNHAFQHKWLGVWLTTAIQYIDNALKQWVEDAHLLANMVKGFIQDTQAALLHKSTILNPEHAKTRKALVENKNFRPCKNGCALLAKWRTHLRKIHEDCGLAGGQEILKQTGDVINEACEWVELIEMIHKVLDINSQKNIFVPKVFFVFYLFLVFTKYM